MKPGSTRDVWDPTRYGRFAAQRDQPGHDLTALAAACWKQPTGPRVVVDLGCGTGVGTVRLHRRLDARSTLGLDWSDAMLDRTRGQPGVRFERGDIGVWEPEAPVDVLYSNAALHWLEGHETLIPRLFGWLAPGGVLAVQVPANHGHASQTAAVAVAQEEPFKGALCGWVRRSPVLTPDRYAVLLHRLGAEDVLVETRVYLHLLEAREALVDWVRGTTLTDYQRRLPDALWERFLERYSEQLAQDIPDESPLPFPFLRTFLVARKP